MSSTGFKQNATDGGYYVPLASLADKIFASTGGNFETVATWARSGAGGGGTPLSTINSIGAGGLLKDMGKTVVSSLRTFRKVQLVIRNSVSTFGVAGKAPTSGEDYFTGYIELGIDGVSTSPAPVAHFGR